MALTSAADFMQSPLVIWAKTTFHASSRLESVSDLADGVYLNEIACEIDPTYFIFSRIKKDVSGDTNLRIQNLELLARELKAYYQEKLQQLLLMRIPNAVTIASDPESNEAIGELTSILLLILGCAVQCEKKEYFIRKITEDLDLNVKSSLMEHIKSITQTENILPFRSNEIAELPSDQLLLLIESMYLQLTQLVEERDSFVGMIAHLTLEKESILHDKHSGSPRVLSPPLSPLPNHGESPSVTVTREKLRVVTEEVEEKNVIIAELRDELVSSKKHMEKLRQENKELAQEARWVKAYRDEIDVLKMKGDRVDRLELENGRYRDKLRDLEYYKKRAEELKEQNELLYESKQVLEEQVAGIAFKEEHIEILEEENKKLKSHIHHLAEERQFDQLKLKEVMEENAQLVLDKQNSMAELAALTSAFDSRSKSPTGMSNLASEWSESSSVGVLRLEKENKELKKTLGQLKTSNVEVSDLVREKSELHNKVMEGKSTIHSLNEEIARVKAQNNVQEAEITKLNHVMQNLKQNLSAEKIVTQQQEVLLNSQLPDEESAKKEADLNAQILEKDEKLAKLSNQTKEREGRLVELSQRAKDNELVIASLGKQMEEKEVKVTALAEKTRHQESTIAALTQDGGDKDRKIDELCEEVRKKDKQLTEKSKAENENKEKALELNEVIQARERRLRSLEARLAESTEEQTQADQQLRQQRKEIVELQNRLDQFSSEKRMVEEQVKRKEEEITDLEARVEEVLAMRSIWNENSKGKDKEMYELQDKLEDMASSKNKLQQSLKLKGEKIAELEAQVEELEQVTAERNRLGQSLENRTKKILELETRLEDLTGENQKLKYTAEQKEGKLRSMENKVEEMEDLARQSEKLSQGLQQKEEKIKSLESKLEEFEDVVSRNEKLTQNLKQKEEKLTRLQDRLDEVEDAVNVNSKLSQSLRNRDEKIRALETRIGELEGDLDNKEKEILEAKRQADYKIRILEQSLEEQTSIKVQRQHSVKRREDKIVDLEKRRTRLEQYMEEREGKIHNLQNQLDGSVDRFRKLDMSIGEREMKIAELEAQLLDARDFSRENRKLNHIMKTKDARIENLETRLQDLEPAVEKLDRENREKQRKVATLQKRLEETVNLNNKLEQSVRKKEEGLRSAEEALQSNENRLEELAGLLTSKSQQLSEFKKKYEDLRNSATTDQENEVSIKEKERKMDELEERIAELSTSANQVEKLKKLNKEREQAILELEVKLEDSSTENVRLEHNLRQHKQKLGDQEKRISALESQSDSSQSQNKVLKQKEERIIQLKRTIDEHQTKIVTLENTLEEENANSQRKDKTLEQKEDRIRKLKSQLEEAIHQKNKLNHAIEQKDERLLSLESRLEENNKDLVKLREELGVKRPSEKDQKQKGSSSQTIIFKPADSSSAEQKAVELLSASDKRTRELLAEVRLLEKQNAKMDAQVETMSAKNARVESENESLKSELSALQADHSALQTDMNDAREYYTEVDLVASKMGHRCEMLTQLNATLEEENKALVDQINKLLGQNQQLLFKSLEEKDHFMEGERLFSDRIYELQRTKERLEEQVDLANRALAESIPKKKKPNLFVRGAHKVLKRAGLAKKRDEQARSKPGVHLLNHTPLHSSEPTSPQPCEEHPSLMLVTPLHARNDLDSVESRDSSVSGDSASRGVTSWNTLDSSFMSNQSDAAAQRRQKSNTVMSPVSSGRSYPDGVVHRRKASHDMSAFRARQTRSEVFGDNWSPGVLGRPRSLEALDKIVSEEREFDTGGTVEAFHVRSSPRASPQRARKPQHGASAAAPGVLSSNSPSAVKRDLYRDQAYPATPPTSQSTSRVYNDSTSPTPTSPRAASKSITLGTLGGRPGGTSPPPSPRSSRSSSLGGAYTRGANSAGQQNSELKDPPPPTRIVDSVVTSVVASPLNSKSPAVDSPNSRPKHTREGSLSGDRREGPSGEIYRSFRLNAVRDTPEEGGVRREGSPAEQRSELSRRNSSGGRPAMRERSLSADKTGTALSPRAYSTLPRDFHLRERKTSAEQNESPINDKGISALPRNQHSRERSFDAENSSPELHNRRTASRTEGSAENSEVPRLARGSFDGTREANNADTHSPAAGPVNQAAVVAHYTSTNSIKKTTTTITSETVSNVSVRTSSASPGAPPSPRGPPPPYSGPANRGATPPAKVQWQSSGVVEPAKDSKIKYIGVCFEEEKEAIAAESVTGDAERPTSPDDDASSTASQSLDCSPAVRRQRKAKKAGREKEIFINTPPCSDTASVTSAQKGADAKQRARSLGPADAGKKSAVWYEYGCV